VEWSEKRKQWCIEDCEGRCLAHAASIRGQAASKEAAVSVTEAMIRDGRMPTLQEARAQADVRDAPMSTDPVDFAHRLLCAASLQSSIALDGCVILQLMLS
jgi:hypothetical protein